MEPSAVAIPVEPERARGAGLSLVAVSLVGGAVAVAVGVYGRVHAPTGGNMFRLGFSSLRETKSWLATGAVVLAVGQVASALAMWGRLPGLRRAPRWMPFAHRWTGTAAFVLSLPVAYHCLWALGFRTTDARVVGHGLLGCAFYGAFATKLLALRSRRLPRWAIPVLGSTLVCLLTGVWLTSALWFFTRA
jgi:hypothetical protein